MIIVSQDKDLIVNFDNITAIGLAQNNSKEIDSITVDGAEQYLAEYATEGRAKDVLQEIITCYTGDGNIQNEGHVFYEMPKE